jgi:UDP-N-acetylmuramoyl-L-alanyl-D-glutamate--2,6-diaminopimelate ligase
VSSYQAEGCPEFLPSAAMFTNLTRDHLHRHRSMASYAAAKRRLFVRGDRAVPLAVVNGDDAFGRRLASEVRERGGRVVTYGWARNSDHRIRSSSWRLREGLVVLDTPSGRVRIRTRLPGVYNAANVAAAVAAAECLHLPRESTLEGLESMRTPPGRFEPVEAGQPFDVVVDFAHSPDGMERAVATARDLTRRRDGRLIVVLGFGAGGHRLIREETGRAARAGADHLILCGSSTKGEPPLIALSGHLAGARAAEGGTLEVVLDRRAAIARGLELAEPGDLVAILGRGPVDRMAHDRHSDPEFFDDREVARELLEEP